MKKKTIIIVVITFVLLCIVLILSNTKKYDKEIISYIEKKGYKLDESGTYVKNITSRDINYFYDNEDIEGLSYRGLSFDINTFELIKNDFKNINGVKLYFIGNYDYKTNKINYTFRIVYENSNAIYQGKYDRKTKKFTCTNTFSHDTDIKQSSNEVCDNAQDSVNEFLSDINSFITNGTYIDYMQKQKVK